MRAENPLRRSYSIESYIRNTTSEGVFGAELCSSGRARFGAAGGLVALIRVQPQTQSIPGVTQNSCMMIEQNIEQAKVHQQRVASVSLPTKTEVPSRALVELVDMAKADQIVATRPGIQRLKLLVFKRGHPGHGLENVPADQGIRSPGPGMGHRVGQGRNTVLGNTGWIVKCFEHCYESGDINDRTPIADRLNMGAEITSNTQVTAPRGSIGEVLGVFLKLGLTSFGGPVAHLGYFRNELVLKRRWIDEAGYGDLVALCQFLPGPASSQVGFALGVLRGRGLLGGLAAWAGFTLPSALILFAFAAGSAALDGPVAAGLLHGLKLVAVAVVAQALWGMARSLAPDKQRAAIALSAVAISVSVAGAFNQILAIVVGALAGLWLCQGAPVAVSGTLVFSVSRRASIAALITFAVLLGLPPIVASITGDHGIALFDAFYRSGAMVFGGGHVVLPLLQAETVAKGWVAGETFLAGYGLAQAVPGPLFTFAAFLGAAMNVPPSGGLGAAIALVAIFLPGLLLVYGSLPFWDSFRSKATAQAAMRGANAAVVGILGSAFYNPVWTSAVLTPRDFFIALAGFLLLAVWKAPSWLVVVILATMGMGFAYIS